MKKIILSAAAFMSIATAVNAADTISDSLKNGKFTIDARVFYFDRSFDTTPSTDSAKVLAAGGIMKYVSDDYNGLKIGLAYFGSNRVSGLYTRDEGKKTAILTPEGENINFLGESYLEYNRDNTMLKVGAQRLSTPLMNDHDLRLLPSSYQAAIVQNRDIADTTLEAGYVWAYSGFTSKLSEFDDQRGGWGEDGLAYIMVQNNSIKELKVSAQYIAALSDTDGAGTEVWVKDYRYADAAYALPFGSNSYIKAQYGGNSFNRAKNDNFPDKDSVMLGAKAGTTFGIVDLAVLANSISGNAFRAVEAGPMYSDWQQGYDQYEPSVAYGVQAVVKPMAGISLKCGYVDVSADEDFRTDGTFTDDFTEINLDLNYALNDMSKVRVRYSVKDQSDESDREDRNDFRVIYYINF